MGKKTTKSQAERRNKAAAAPAAPAAAGAAAARRPAKKQSPLRTVSRSGSLITSLFTWGLFFYYLFLRPRDIDLTRTELAAFGPDNEELHYLAVGHTIFKVLPTPETDAEAADGAAKTAEVDRLRAALRAVSGTVVASRSDVDVAKLRGSGLLKTDEDEEDMPRAVRQQLYWDRLNELIYESDVLRRVGSVKEPPVEAEEDAIPIDLNVAETNEAEDGYVTLEDDE